MKIAVQKIARTDVESVKKQNLHQENTCVIESNGESFLTAEDFVLFLKSTMNPRSSGQEGIMDWLKRHLFGVFSSPYRRICFILYHSEYFFAGDSVNKQHILHGRPENIAVLKDLPRNHLHKTTLELYLVESDKYE